jgi:hypothetical protein
MSKTLSFELTEELRDLVIDVLKEKRDDLMILLKEQEGLEDTTIRDIQLQHTQINDCIRELQFYAINK